MSTSPTVEQEATLVLINELLRSVASSSPTPVNVQPLPTFAALSDGRALYFLLSQCSPAAFGDVEEMTANTSERARTNRALRREHLRTLATDVNAFTRATLLAPSSPASAAPTFDLHACADVNAIANASSLMGVPDDDDPSEAAHAVAELYKLVVAVLAVLMLSGAMRHEVEGAGARLPPEQQQLLQTAVEDFKLRHGLMEVTVSPRGSNAPVRAAAGGGGRSPLLAASPATAVDAQAARLATHMDPGHASSAALFDTGDSYYRNLTMQLRRELEEAREGLSSAEQQCLALRDSEQSWERRYRLLLEEQTTTTAATAPATPAATATDGERLATDGPGRSSGPTVADLNTRLAAKEEAVQSLSRRIEEQNTALATYKQATTALEQGLLSMKRKLKSAEEGLMARSAERRDALERLSNAEDKLAIQLKAKAELENEAESLRSQVMVLRLTQRPEDADGGGGAEHRGLAGSFASNGSLDRVMQLETEIDEVRAQREALQKQLFILQKQTAANSGAGGAIGARGADIGTAGVDTLRAQVRQLTREKEQAQQHLAEALERVEALQASAAVTSPTQLATAETSTMGSPLGSVAAPADRSASTSTREADSSSPLSGAPAKGPTGGDASTASAPAALALGSATPAAAADMLSTGDAKVRLRRLRETTQREQAILSSLLLQYGYRNLLLQQHQQLLYEDQAEAAQASHERIATLREGEEAVFGSASGCGGGGSYACSLLSRQRLEIEHGLLNSIIHSTRRREPSQPTEVTSLTPTPESQHTASAPTLTH